MHFNSFDEYLSAVTQVHEGNVRELGRVDETQPTEAAEEPVIAEESAEEPAEEPEEPKKAAKKAPAKKGAKK